jgi:hypothetical protein
MATPKQEAFWMLQFAKHESAVSVNGSSGDNFRVIPRLPTALGVGMSSFRQRGAFVKEKVQDVRVCQKKV